MPAAVRTLALAGGAASAARAANMNGKYIIASGEEQSAPFNDDYASKGHEYFDLWSPEIATHYGEVFWTGMGVNPIPADIIKRFEGKAIAVTGYEHDQVMVTPQGQPGLNPEQDVSVPMNWAYNHHYQFWITGKHAEMWLAPVAPDDPMAHGATERWVARDKPSAALRADPSLPTSQYFSEGNGGESRKSYHGFPNGFAQIIDNPDSWHATPMQIDTRNRDCGVRPESVNNCTKFVPGPEPKQARYGRGIPSEGTDYSGVLECPCNEGYGGDPFLYPDAGSKIVQHSYTIQASGQCSDVGLDVPSAEACFAAATTLGVNATSFKNETISKEDLPPGCSVETEKDGSATVFFNTGGKAPCTSGELKVGQVTSAVNVTLGLELDSSGLFQRSASGVFCQMNRKTLIQRFELNPSLPTEKAAASDALDRCEAYCFDADDSCWGCSVDCQGNSTGSLIERKCGWNAIGACGQHSKWSGAIQGDISQKSADGGKVKITVSGPSDVWFGVGLNAHYMSDQPYGLIVNESGMFEQRIGTCGDEARHCAGDTLSSSITLVSNTVVNGIRTCVVTRGVLGITEKHYSFDPKNDDMSLITAVGKSQEFAYHDRHGPATISLTTVGSPTCVCDLGLTGSICEAGGKHCSDFKQNCKSAADGGDLLTQHNPTCNSGHYSGGLKCCRHQHIMLDLDQQAESLKRDVLHYHMKIRVWFKELTKDTATGEYSHANLDRIYYQTEANAGEYDVPPAFARADLPVFGYNDYPLGVPTPGTTCKGSCPDGPDCECEHQIMYRWTVSNIRLIYAGAHCHAPSCISITLYINTTGTLEPLCSQIGQYGKGNFPVDKFDEKNFLTIPPCLWSDDPKEGLQPTVWLPKDTPVVSIKKNRNTHMGHFGEMASWQMRGVSFQSPSGTQSLFI